MITDDGLTTPKAVETEWKDLTMYLAKGRIEEDMKHHRKYLN